MLKLLRLLRPYHAQVAAVLVLALAQSIGFLLLPRLMSDIVDTCIVKGDQRDLQGGDVRRPHDHHGVRPRKEVGGEFDQLNETYYDSAWRAQFVSAIIMPTMMFVGNLGYVLVAVIGGERDRCHESRQRDTARQLRPSRLDAAVMSRFENEENRQ